MGLDLLEKITNPYERKARLYPAFLALVPIISFVIGLHGIELKVETLAIGLSATFGVLYLMMSIARELGKRLERSLFEEWGGKPTTQILRHRDKTIDSITKYRYHVFLSKHLSVSFPSKETEESDPIAADEIYQSAVKWLLDKTRDKKTFDLLFQENIAFGFYRNCLGLKPFAELIAFIILFLPLISHGVVTITSIESNVISSISKGAWVSSGASLLMLIIWMFFLTKKTAKSAAFRYAEKLLQACDVLPKKR